MPSDFDDLLTDLKKFDPCDLCGIVGALQLLPENCERQLQIERLMATAFAIPLEEKMPTISSGRMRKIAQHIAIRSPETLSKEDPAEGLFSDVLTFHGKSFTVLKGIVNDAEALQNLLAVLESPDAQLPQGTVNALSDVALCVLEISNQIAEAAGIGRYQVPVSSDEDLIVLPGRAKLIKLREAVTFSKTEFDDLLSSNRSPDLGFMTTTPGSEIIDPDDGDGLEKLYRFPLVSFDDCFVVVNPSGLLTALRHFLLSKIVDNGLHETFVAESLAIAYKRAHTTFSQMGLVPLRSMHVANSISLMSSIWACDPGKDVLLVVAVDDLAGYSDGGLYSQWSSKISRDLIAHVQSCEQQKLDHLPDSSELLVVLAVQTSGRTTQILQTSPKDDSTMFLSFESRDLEIAADTLADDRLGLWKFASQKKKLEDASRIFAWSDLDLFALYRDRKSSFYLSDDQQPTVISVSSNQAASLRQSQARRNDYHVLTNEEGPAVLSRRWTDYDYPVFTNHSATDGAVELYVENRVCNGWISFTLNSRASLDPAIGVLACEMAAYWLVEILTNVPEELAGLSRHENIEIKITAGDTHPDSLIQDQASWFRTTVSGDRQITLQLLPSAKERLATSSNDAEREFVSNLLLDLSAVADTGNLQSQLDELTDRIAPLGVKKICHILTTENSAALTPGHLPAPRVKHEADASEVTDWLSQKLIEEFDLAVGVIDPSIRKDVANEAVKILFDEFEKIVSEFDSSDFLEQLVVYHEAVVQRKELCKLKLASQEACFGARAFELGFEEIDDCISTDIVLRFLIEYVAACPSSGDQPFSLSAYDRLLALGTSIISHGQTSDIVHYGLGDPELKFLPSGRVAFIESADFRNARNQFFTRRGDDALSQASMHYDRLFGTTNIGLDEDVRTRLNSACSAEFGVSVDSLVWIHSAIEDAAIESQTEPMVVLEGELIEQIHGATELPVEIVKKTIDLFCLGPRPDFFPSEGAALVFPWRYNRSLSYMHRPLLRLPNDRGNNILFGLRHYSRSGAKFLVEQLTTNRHKAHSHEMQKFLGSFGQPENDKFNDLVADLYERNRNLIVEKRVKKIAEIKLHSPEKKDLGDIDVLVINPAQKSILVIEAKDFEAARTPFELSNEIEKLAVGEKSVVAKHNKRVDWIKTHVKDVVNHYQLDSSNSRWKVIGFIATSEPLFGSYLEESQLDVLYYKDLPHI